MRAGSGRRLKSLLLETVRVGEFCYAWAIWFHSPRYHILIGHVREKDHTKNNFINEGKRMYGHGASASPRAAQIFPRDFACFATLKQYKYPNAFLSSLSPSRSFLFFDPNHKSKEEMFSSSRKQALDDL